MKGEKNMVFRNEYSDVLKSVGYDVESKGAIYFGSLLDEVRELLKAGADEKTIRKVLPNYKLEDFHFFFEVPKENYDEELDKFCNSRVVTEANKKMNKEIMGETTANMDVNTSLIFFAKMFNDREQRAQELKNTRLLIKNNNTGILQSVKQ